MGPLSAVIVTYNRSEMLRRCLAALGEQTRPPDRILVVDNASTDGTASMLEREHPTVEVLRLTVNEGGAGGFHEGIRRAYESGMEWLWLMDDDTIPTPSALEELLAAAERLDGTAPALLASRVIWRDGSLHPMNSPIFERRRMDRVIGGADHALSEEPWQQAYTSLLVSWAAEMVLGAREGGAAPAAHTRLQPFPRRGPPTPA